MKSNQSTWHCLSSQSVSLIFHAYIQTILSKLMLGLNLTSLQWNITFICPYQTNNVNGNLGPTLKALNKKQPITLIASNKRQVSEVDNFTFMSRIRSILPLSQRGNHLPITIVICVQAIIFTFELCLLFNAFLRSIQNGYLYFSGCIVL